MAANLRVDPEACGKGVNNQPVFRAKATDLTLLDFEKPAYSLGGRCAESRQISADSEGLDGLPGCKIG
jgi:hypothetical protein